MSALDQVFQHSPVSKTATIDPNASTQMTEISPIANHEDDLEQTPEPKSPTQTNLDEEEEKDPLYNDLAPKQNIGQQLKSVVDSVPDQNKIINPDESLPAYSENPKSKQNNYDHLKSTLKKQQRYKLHITPPATPSYITNSERG